jgi:hypothetical protein
MTNSASRREVIQNGSAVYPTTSWQVLKKRPWQLIAASVLLAVWIVFLMMMAVYN